MLQSFVAPVIILAASLCTDSNCFLLSVDALSQTTLLYSRRGLMKEMYIFFSRAFLLILNFSTRSKLSLSHAVFVMLFMCSVQLQLFASVNP